jgi:hypothetical protein
VRNAVIVVCFFSRTFFEPRTICGIDLYDTHLTHLSRNTFMIVRQYRQYSINHN